MNKKLKRFFDWYVIGKYHCDKCPYCWCGGYNAGCDDYDDCGCYIKGDIRDTCRLLPPFRFLLGYFKSKKVMYDLNHEYDGYVEYIKEKDKQQSELNRLLKEFVGEHELCWADENGVYHPIDTQMHIFQESWRIFSSYEDFAHPIQHIPIRKQWLNLFKATLKLIINKFKPYFCK